MLRTGASPPTTPDTPDVPNTPDTPVTTPPTTPKDPAGGNDDSSPKPSKVTPPQKDFTAVPKAGIIKSQSNPDVAHGVRVNTGGEVEHRSIFAKILDIFRS